VRAPPAINATMAILNADNRTACLLRRGTFAGMLVMTDEDGRVPASTIMPAAYLNMTDRWHKSLSGTFPSPQEATNADVSRSVSQ
jgi:hypothetical protein